MSIFVDTDETRAWRDYLETLSPPERPVVLPTGNELLATLRYLEVPEEDVPDVAASSPSPETDPELWWYLERSVWSLVSKMGSIEQAPRFAPLRDFNDPRHRFFYVHVFVAALPFVQSYFQSKGIPEDIAQATLADLGRNVRVHRKREGVGGLGVMWWLTLHFRGAIYHLGRLQFERVRLREEYVTGIRSAGLDVEDGEHALSIHIPDFIGPMTPEACDESIRRARAFFPQYFPEEPVRYAVCSSWLLDPQLKQYLRPTSNIIRFQDRFQLVDGGWESNTGIMQLVFGAKPEDIDSIRPRTSLERGVVHHLANGGTWYGRGGWFRLDGDRAAD